MLSRLVSSEIGARSAPSPIAAVVCLCLLTGYVFVRAQLHARAIATLEARLYGGEPPRRTAALPTSAAPWLWTGVVETSTAWRVGAVDLLTAFDPEATRVFYKPDLGPLAEPILRTDTARVFLDFSQLPLWTVTPLPEPEGGVRVSVHDLRFGVPEDNRFTSTFVLDSSRRVLSESFTF
jgi:hypothetical protein